MKKRQWDDMFIDIDAKVNLDKDFFIGSIIFEKRTNESRNLYIIDGQQRLTSILLLLSVVRKRFTKTENEHLARGMAKLY